MAAPAAGGPYQWQASNQQGAGGKQTAPATERNKQVILEELCKHLPPAAAAGSAAGSAAGGGGGLVLEVASGTGQHVAHFAHALPHLQWQPTDVSDQLFASIQAHAAGLGNVLPPQLLDASQPVQQWPSKGPCVAVIAANVTHIAPWSVTQGLVAGASTLLQPGGVLFIYGPFKLDGQFTTDSNRQFHDSLVATNPEWGYRDTADVTALAAASGLVLMQVVPMPANNFALVYHKL